MRRPHKPSKGQGRTRGPVGGKSAMVQLGVTKRKRAGCYSILQAMTVETGCVLNHFQSGVGSKTKDGWTHILLIRSTFDRITLHGLAHPGELNNAVSSRATRSINRVDNERVGNIKNDARICQKTQTRRTAPDTVGFSRGDRNLSTRRRRSHHVAHGGSSFRNSPDRHVAPKRRCSILYIPRQI